MATTTKTPFYVPMDAETPKTMEQRDTESQVRSKLRLIGPSAAVKRFVDAYGKVKTKRNYLVCLWRYLGWLKSKGVTMTPDELVKDNLLCVFKSDPTDVITKRKHTDFLNDFGNVFLVQRGMKEKSREVYAASIQQFYRRNDSQLWGSFSVSRGDAEEPAPALRADDIRRVLKVLPVNVRTPLLFVWQSGCEIDRVLSLTWKDVERVDRNENPLKLSFWGRKRHRRPYSSFLGLDSIELLKVYRGMWVELMGREPAPNDLIFMGKNVQQRAAKS